jgi:hypothetical protein
VLYKDSPYRAVNTLYFGYKNQSVGDVLDKFTVCSEIHTKHKKQCNHRAEILNVKPGSGFGGLGVACCLKVPKFAGSNPAEAVRIFNGGKSSASLPSEGK